MNDPLYQFATLETETKYQTAVGQIESRANIEQTARDNPDLPVSFIENTLAALAEPREQTTT